MALSGLSQIKVPYDGKVLTPASASRLLHEKRPLFGRSAVSQRDLHIIANLRASPHSSVPLIGQSLSGLGEPPLSLADFGLTLQPDGQIVVMTNRPVVRTIAWLLEEETNFSRQALRTGALSLYSFSLVRDYFNSLMPGRAFLYPNDGLARQLNAAFPAVFRRFGLEGFTMNGSPSPFFHLEKNSEATVADFLAGRKRVPVLGVVLAHESCLEPFIRAWFESRRHS